MHETRYLLLVPIQPLSLAGLGNGPDVWALLSGLPIALDLRRWTLWLRGRRFLEGCGPQPEMTVDPRVSVPFLLLFHTTHRLLLRPLGPLKLLWLRLPGSLGPLTLLWLRLLAPLGLSCLRLLGLVGPLGLLWLRVLWPLRLLGPLTLLWLTLLRQVRLGLLLGPLGLPLTELRWSSSKLLLRWSPLLLLLLGQPVQPCLYLVALFPVALPARPHWPARVPRQGEGTRWWLLPLERLARPRYQDQLARPVEDLDAGHAIAYRQDGGHAGVKRCRQVEGVAEGQAGAGPRSWLRE